MYLSSSTNEHSAIRYKSFHNIGKLGGLILWNQGKSKLYDTSSRVVGHGSSGGSIPNMGKWEVGLGGTRTREGAAEFSTNPHCYI